MIRLVEKEEQQRRLLALCEKTAFGCKIASLALAYGFDKGFACTTRTRWCTVWRTG